MAIGFIAKDTATQINVVYLILHEGARSYDQRLYGNSPSIPWIMTNADECIVKSRIMINVQVESVCACAWLESPKIWIG